MSFLTAKHELANTYFPAPSLRIAQLGLEAMIRETCPGWVRKPRGWLSKRWKSASECDCCYIIELYRILDNLEKHTDKASLPSLKMTMTRLFNAKDEVQYEATLNELQVADFLVTKGVSIQLEPAVQKRTGEQGRPDIGLNLDQPAYLDVTRFRFSVLDAWEECLEGSIGALRKCLGNDGCGKIVSIDIPLEARQTPLTVEHARQLAPHILTEDSGKFEVRWQTHRIVVSWFKVPVNLVDGELQVGSEELDFLCTVKGANPNLSAVIHFNEPDIEATDLLVKALRTRVDEKRKQFTAPAPYLIAIRVGHFQQFLSPIAEIVVNRLWTNPQYHRISGIILFVPQEEFVITPDRKELSKFNVLFNPAATYPVSPSFRAQLTAR